jgi:hypothetical protein
MDGLQRDVERLVAASAREPRTRVFERVWALATGRLADGEPKERPGVPPAIRRRGEIAYLDEPWYC